MATPSKTAPNKSGTRNTSCRQIPRGGLLDKEGPIYADSDADAPVYNISGQRVSKKQRGINVIKGRKVVVR